MQKMSPVAMLINFAIGIMFAVMEYDMHKYLDQLSTKHIGIFFVTFRENEYN
jgi:hypothetical protein